MGLLDNLLCHDIWLRFLEDKLSGGSLSGEEGEALFDFVENRQYLPAAEKIVSGSGDFPYPQKRLISKLGGKKRVVYCFPAAENIVLKFIAQQLYIFDAVFSDNLYSFRKEFGVKKALGAMAGAETAPMYFYKLDIKNYFNSIDIPLLLPVLKGTFGADRKLYSFFEKLLTADKAYFCGGLITEKRGAMAGAPFSPFLANLYLKSLDAWFYERGAVYARYSDDIIVFANSEEELSAYKEHIRACFSDMKLSVNPSKEITGTPGMPWEFLGVRYQGGEILLSQSSLEKIKGKIRRKARSLYRWKERKAASPEKAVGVMIKRMNAKFFGGEGDKELTWARWFFPLLTKADDLCAIDVYMQDWLRYIVTGRHNKANYEKAPYAFLKECGYRSLTHEYFLFQKRRQLPAPAGVQASAQTPL